VCDLANSKRGSLGLSWAVATQGKKNSDGTLGSTFPSFSDYPAAPSFWAYLAYSHDNYLFIIFSKNI
jgi:hypothetical protein